MGTHLIAIDPGLCTGYACFLGGALVHAGICAAKDGDFWRCIPRFDRCTDLHVVIERPTVYPGEHGNANDLITLAIQVGELKYHYRLHGATVQEIQPRTWKGQVPKAIHHARILKELCEHERACLPHLARSVEHNMLDAVGLGLWGIKQRGWIRLRDNA